ncbi:hypothetical protein SDC9_182804 [bioreactor metagenome]|uniref:Uncharacterized protein n=1 Tax=bioreactor metagenome TaxID=1076179 RepID=A0A645H8E3_9ZZZZ
MKTRSELDLTERSLISSGLFNDEESLLKLNTYTEPSSRESLFSKEEASPFERSDIIVESLLPSKAEKIAMLFPDNSTL